MEYVELIEQRKIMNIEVSRVLLELHLDMLAVAIRYANCTLCRGVKNRPVR